MRAIEAALYSVGSVGSGAFYAFNNFVLPPLLKGLGATDLMVGLLSSTRSLEGAIVQPTVGALSDRTWTRLGRRRPFILVGVPLSALFFVAAASADSLLAIALAIVLFSLFFNLALDPYAALLADIVNSRRRITADTAVRLSLFFGNSPEFWMNLQTHHDLKLARRNLKAADVERIRSQRVA